MTLASEKPTTPSDEGSGTKLSTRPAAPEDDSLDALATRILARSKGVPGPVPSDILGAIGRGIRRIIVFPMSIAIGAVLGVAGSLLAFVVQATWWKKIALFFVAPFAGPVLGGALGWRLLARGKLDGLPLAASILHRFSPVVAFSKALSHNMSGLVVITSYDDVRLVLERNDVFSVSGYDERMRAATGPFILGMDPGATYEKEQSIAAKAVGREIAPLRELAADLSRALVDKAYDRSRTLDVVTELAHAVQMAVVDRFYGVPDTRDEKLIPWLETMSFFLFNLWIGGPYHTAAVEAGHELTAHLRRIVRQRSQDLTQGAPGKDDVLGRMLEIFRASGDPQAPTSEEFMVRTMAGLVSGATVAMMGLFVQCVDLLLVLPADERAALRKAAQLNDDATVKRFVIEAARFSAYPPTLYRHVLTPFVFHPGTKNEATAERGAWVLTLPIMANYDASVFPNPDHFNPMREYAPGRGPLLFGWAQHQCLGTHMAELLMVEMAKALFAKGVHRAPGPDGRIQNGDTGVIPDGDYPAHLIVAFD